MNINKSMQGKNNPVADAKAVIQGNNWRFTILTQCLVRFEYSRKGSFEDRQSQLAVNRKFPVPSYKVDDTGKEIYIHTGSISILYDKKEFSPEGLSFELGGALTAYHNTWQFGDHAKTLGGTVRTLDEADGEVPLGEGIISRNGYAVIDDSRTALVCKDGSVVPRKADGGIDMYFFGYGHDYRRALFDYYTLSGFPPVLPRYALGAWWSKFHRYSADEYLALVERFGKEGIPFSVAVLDVDWHVTQIDPEYGSGWTGYTWNRELFPDPDAFLSQLHEKGMHVTLNEHPAAGVRPVEEQYPAVSKVLNIDPSKDETIRFDVSNKAFMDAYFLFLHDSEENRGVDFWWIDWQQRGGSSVPGIDTLWMLNHTHFKNNGRSGKRALILSRYAGPGSHRYPIGFSGDTFATWASLDFQPYFTSTAANIGYGWWSHDIGGHMHGIKDNELTVRWIQFGVFSPVMRIHGSDNIFNEKEPWNYPPEYETVMKKFIRLRHALVPYLYTMNVRAAEEGIPLVLPVYYTDAEKTPAYENKNEYWFGSGLLVNPITSPMKRTLCQGMCRIWLPEGTWYDFFTGYKYAGNRTLEVFRPLDEMPVFAKAGSIIPLTDEVCIQNDVSNPKTLEVKVFCGSDGTFSMKEDDCVSAEGKAAQTDFTWTENQNGSSVFDLCINGDNEIIPADRTYSFSFTGCADCSEIELLQNGTKIPFEKRYEMETHTLKVRPVSSYGIRNETGSCITVKMQEKEREVPNDTCASLLKSLRRAQLPFDLKNQIWQLYKAQKDVRIFLGELTALNIETDLYAMIVELVTAYPA